MMLAPAMAYMLPAASTPTPAAPTAPPAARVRARRQHEVELQLLLVAVEDEVDARVHLAIDDAPIGRHVAPPGRRIQRRHVMDLPRQHLLGRDTRGRCAADETQP